MIVGEGEVSGRILSVKAHILVNEIDISQNHGGQLEAGFPYLSLEKCFLRCGLAPT